MGLRALNNKDSPFEDVFAGTGNLAGFEPGESVFATSGAYTWVAPKAAAAFGVSILCIGGGGGARGIGGAGGGGGLGYKNNYSVTAGQGYAVQVGAPGDQGTDPGPGPALAGGDSYFVDASTVKGGGGVGGQRDAWGSAPHAGGTGGAGGTYTGDGGGNGGSGGDSPGWPGSGNYPMGGGGGAGGYAGNGGNGGDKGSVGTAGAGGGGGGGGGMGPGQNNGGGGGGTGIYGQGPNGTAGSAGPSTPSPQPIGHPGMEGGGGSSGGGGSFKFSQPGTGVYPAPTSPYDESGGEFGGGGGNYYKGGGPGVVRIIWGAETREFPTTNVGPSPEV